MGTTGYRITLWALLIAVALPYGLQAQQPFINSISPNQAEVDRIVEITGLNFSGSPRVFFSGVEATILPGSTDNLIQARVPAGATNGSVYVLNNGEIAQSNERFYISFGGTTIDTYDAEVVYSTGQPTSADLCLCDLNADGKNDVVLVHDRETDPTKAEATVFLNTSTDSDAFTAADFQVTPLNIVNHDDGFIAVVCQDFDNNGTMDLAFTSESGTDANDVFVLSNPGTGVFSTTPTIANILTTTEDDIQRQPGAIVSADIDKDGLMDLIVGNLAKDGIFHIFRNTSTVGTISFTNAIEIATDVEESTNVLISTGILYAADFNEDGLQDLIITAFRETNAAVHLFRNQSNPNDFDFVYDGSVTNGGQISDIEAGDLDNDGDLDLVVAVNREGIVSYFENQSTSPLISFSTAVTVSTSATLDTGIGLEDMDGDGLLDILSSNVTGGIYLIENNSAGSISFLDGSNEQIISTSGATTGFVAVGDVNSDAKPDIIYSREIDDDPSSIGVVLNRNCISPLISPQDFSYCVGEPFTLQTINAASATINWQVVTGNGVITTNGNPEAEITITGGANASIRVTITQDDCTEVSDFLNLTVAGDDLTTTTPTINVSVPGVICEGESVTLSSSITSDEYFWTLPDGSESTAETIQLDPISVEDAGTYTLQLQTSGRCISDEVTQTINVSSVPDLTITNSGLSNFCDEIVLQVPDFTGEGLTYQWQRGGTDLGQTNAALTVNQSGTYTLEATNTDNCSKVTSSLTVNRIALPTAIIDGPSETCLDFLTSFTAASTGESGFTLEHAWSIENASNVEVFSSTASTIDFQFPTTGTYTVFLNSSYRTDEVYAGPNTNDLCATTETLTLTVSDPPTITFDQADGTQKCQDEALPLAITSPPAGEIASYEWTVGGQIIGTDPTVNVTTDIGIDEVDVVATITTSIGCTVSNNILIRNFQSDVDISSPDFPTIASADSATLEEAISIDLSAENLASGISWEPADLIDNPTGASIQYFPRNPTSTVILSGVDEDGCNVATQVVIYLDNLRPKKTFSPNGDGINDCWEILNIGELGTTADCEVIIFDSRGRNLTGSLTDFPADNCVWNGTSSGSDVPEGIYYYVLKCGTEEFSKSGSILLAR